MALTKKILVALGLDDREFNSKLQATTKKLKVQSREMQKEGRRLSIMSREIFMGLTLPMGLLAHSVVRATAEMESMSLGLKAIASSRGITAIGHLQQEIEKIAKLPGLGLRESFNAVQQLLSVGIGSKDSLRVVEGLGIGIARAGGSAENFNRVMRQLTQGLAKGKLEMQDFKTVFEQMPESRRILENAFGPGMGDLDKLRKSGKSVNDVMFALADGFKELGAKGFMDSVSNKIENLGDSWLKFRAALGTEIFQDLIHNGLDLMSGSLDSLTDAMRDMSPAWKDFIKYLTIAVGGIAIIVPALGFLAKTWKLLAAQILGARGAAAVGLALGTIAPYALALGAALGGIEIIGRKLIPTWKGLSAELKDMGNVIVGLMRQNRGFNALYEMFQGKGPSRADAMKRRGAGSSLGFLVPQISDTVIPVFEEAEKKAKALDDAIKNLSETFKKRMDIRAGFLGADPLRSSTQDNANALFANDRNNFLTQVAGISGGAERALGIENMAKMTQAVREGQLAYEEYMAILEQVEIHTAKFNDQLEELYAGEIGKGIEGIANAFGTFIDTALQGAPDAFGAMADAFKKAMKDMIVGLVSLIAKLAIAAILVNIIFPGQGGLKALSGGFGIFGGDGAKGGFLNKIFGGLGIPGFAGGGVVGGNSPYGDKILARVNSGELMLNPAQQKAAYAAMNGGGIRIYGELRARGRDLVYVFEETQKQINATR